MASAATNATSANLPQFLLDMVTLPGKHQATFRTTRYENASFKLDDFTRSEIVNSSFGLITPQSGGPNFLAVQHPPQIHPGMAFRIRRDGFRRALTHHATATGSAHGSLTGIELETLGHARIFSLNPAIGPYLAMRPVALTCCKATRILAIHDLRMLDLPCIGVRYK